MAYPTQQQINSTGATSTTPTITLLSAPTVGNLLVATLAWSSSATFTPPAGWLTLGSIVNTGLYETTYVIYRYVQSGDGTSYAGTLSASSTWNCTVQEFSNVDSNTPFNGSNFVALNTQNPSVAATPSAASYPCAIFYTRSQGTDFTPGVGWTEDAFKNNSGCGLQTLHSTETGTTAVTASTTFSAAHYCTAAIFFINPAADAPPPPPPPPPAPTNLRDLIQADSQLRYIQLQVRRNGNWISVPIDSAQGSIGKNKAGSVNVHITSDDTDPVRSQLYEGDRIRMFRGVLGAAPQRCWTGYVDSRSPADSMGISRDVVITDHIKEITDAIMIDGAVYDGLLPMQACADALQRAINTQQLKIYDDNDNLQSTTASYSSPTGNSVCYFPDIINPDNTTFNLPQGSIGSYSTPAGQFASFMIPVASGASYSTFELPNQYIIASTMSVPGFTIASTGASQFPPASGTTIVDFYNGIMYFNAGQASTTCSFSASYYDQPNYNFPAGTKIVDIIGKIMDDVGCRWGVDANGKFYSTVIDTVRAPQRILNKGQYVSNAVEINRDRRNVIVCLGWDGNCGGIVAAKAVNTDDINNAPPKGLGKRAYLVAQDRAWQTQYAVDRAAYYAVQQVGRRGKVVNVQILDDPTITSPETVLCFESTIPEIGPGDFFYVEDITWNYAMSSSQGMTALMSLSGTLLPGQGLVYLGPISGATSYGSLDYSQDVQPITNPHLSPAGGQFSSTFSIAAGLTLTYTIGSAPITESVDIYGSDGSHIVGDANVLRAANQTLTLALPVASMTAGVMYAVRLWCKDNNGNVGVYRDFITARA